MTLPKFILFGSVLAGLALVTACSGGRMETAATPADPAPINDLRSRYQTAHNAGDAAALTALYTEDAVIMPEHQAAVQGRTAIRQYYQEMFEKASANISITPADTDISGDVAHEHGTFSVTVTPKGGGAAMTENGKYLVVLKRQSDGSWLIHHEIGNSNDPMPVMPGHDAPKS